MQKYYISVGWINTETNNKQIPRFANAPYDCRSTDATCACACVFERACLSGLLHSELMPMAKLITSKQMFAFATVFASFLFCDFLNYFHLEVVLPFGKVMS